MSANVASALSWARQQGLDRLDAQLLLAHALKVDRTWLVTHDDHSLDAALYDSYVDHVHQRLQEVPLAYLTGEKAFHGLTLQVSPAVLVPRPDTETLVDWALEWLQTSTLTAPEVVDLGTGSGAIALAVKHAAPQVQMHMVDLSPEALAVAQGNAQRFGLAVQAHQGSWWDALPAELRFDLVLSNPPYIAGGDPHLPALRHEPTLALTPGGDGLSALQAIVQGAPVRLNPGAPLLLEHGYDQAEAVMALLRDAGFEAVSCRQDLGGQTRVSGGIWPG